MGVTGAILMILAPSVILAHAPRTERGRTGGAIYTGVGFGAAVSGVIVAPLAEISIPLVWAALAGICAVAALLSWPTWRATAELPAAPSGVDLRLGWPVLLVCLAYATDGMGFVPHSIFLVDYVARGLGLGASVGALSWVLFSLGAMLGPITVGLVADQVGLARALVGIYLVKAAAVFLPALVTARPALMLSAFVVGALSPGLSSLTAGRIAELVHPALQARNWGMATLVFSAAQAGSAALMSLAFARIGSYQPLFLAGGCLLLLGALVSLAAGRRRDRS